VDGIFRGVKMGVGRKKGRERVEFHVTMTGD
jgi:hypothetical protein